MTPTEQEMEFFTSGEAKRIQELWEPKFGDWVRLAPHDLYDFEDGIIVLPVDNGEDIVVVRTDDHQHLLLYPSELIWLPRQGQLQAMLKEITGKRFGVLPVEFHGEEYWIAPFPGSSFERYKKGKSANARGPTPSIALGKCLLELLKEE